MNYLLKNTGVTEIIFPKSGGALAVTYNKRPKMRVLRHKTVRRKEVQTSAVSKIRGK